MNGKHTTYIITFFAEGVNIWALTRYLHDSRDIILTGITFHLFFVSRLT
jgi:hypothetical protein